MPHSYVNLLYHIVFSTRDRQPHLTIERRPRLYEYIGGVIRKRGGISLAINGMDDHVHVLTKLRPDKAISEVIRDLKAGSSGWMHQFFPEVRDFKWQNGYGAFTVSSSLSKKVTDYIRDQDRHHVKLSFRDEFTLLLRKNGIEFDERYLWQ
ncbi:MAG: IS200/IS605 family transposase [Pyrinomonadaceae bacterium]